MSPASAMLEVPFREAFSSGSDAVADQPSHDFTIEIGSLSLRLTSHSNFDAVRAQWHLLEQTFELSPFQSFDWCRQFWLSGLAGPSARLDLVIATSPAGEVDLLMPLVTQRCCGVLVSRMLNDSNAAHRAPVMRPHLIEALSKADERTTLFKALRKITGADVLELEQQPVSFNGQPHPLLSPRALNHHEEISDAVFSDESWDAFDRTHRSSKSRARDRKRVEGLSKLGEVSLYQPRTLLEKQVFLDEILTRKSLDLKSRGVHVFENPATRDFLMRIAALSPETSPTYSDLIGLRVGGTWAAAHFGIIHGKIGAGLIIAMGMPEAREHSPGHALIVHVLKDHFDRGMRRFSFGLGESDLKKRWTDERVAVASEAIPLSLMGVPYAALKRVFWWAKREVKHRRELFSAASQLRVVLHRMKGLFAA